MWRGKDRVLGRVEGRGGELGTCGAVGTRAVGALEGRTEVPGEVQVGEGACQVQRGQRALGRMKSVRRETAGVGCEHARGHTYDTRARGWAEKPGMWEARSWLERNLGGVAYGWYLKLRDRPREQSRKGGGGSPGGEAKAGRGVLGEREAGRASACPPHRGASRGLGGRGTNPGLKVQGTDTRADQRPQDLLKTGTNEQGQGIKGSS